MVDVLLDLELGRDPTHERDSVLHDRVRNFQVQELDLLTLLDQCMFVRDLMFLEIPVVKQGTSHMNWCALLVDIMTRTILTKVITTTRECNVLIVLLLCFFSYLIDEVFLECLKIFLILLPLSLLF